MKKYILISLVAIMVASTGSIVADHDDYHHGYGHHDDYEHHHGGGFGGGYGGHPPCSRHDLMHQHQQAMEVCHYHGLQEACMHAHQLEIAIHNCPYQ